jgi:NAD(P)-dependent dehydrogenase (short-subunit alcohol dehydrogenase family)
MNVTVFGATGAIGRQVVEQLRSNGHAVTAYVRNPAKVPATWGEDVEVVVGEITDAGAIDRAVAGADADGAVGGRPAGRRRDGPERLRAGLVVDRGRSERSRHRPRGARRRDRQRRLARFVGLRRLFGANAGHVRDAGPAAL